MGIRARLFFLLTYAFPISVACFAVACAGPQGSETVITKNNPPSSNSGCSSGAAGPTSLHINSFLENPITSSGNPLLSFTSTLTTGYTVAATIDSLDGSCLLRNSRYSLTTDSLFPANIVTFTSSSALYSPAQPEFRQLNSFYQINELKKLLESLGADLSAMGQVAIDANCNISNNAYFSPSSKKLCFGYSDQGSGKKVWAADDADAVTHEAGHSINHTLASTSIMNSSGEAGAIDESIADYWALTMMSDPELSEWFLGALGSSYIRDATQSILYPNQMVYEIHDDSRVLTQVLWDLRKSANLGKATTDALVKRALQILPATTRFKDFYRAFYDASGPAFLNLSAGSRALIVSKFTAKGLHRVDSANGMRLSTRGGAIKQIYVIDDHSYTYQQNGNCNGSLDVGETALVLVNLENVNASRMGMAVATLSSISSGIQAISGGEVGEFFRFNSSSDFIASLPSSSSNREDATVMASFLLKATSAGAKNLNMTILPMYADPTGSVSANPSVTVNFSINVGSAANATSCSDNTLWP